MQNSSPSNTIIGLASTGCALGICLDNPTGPVIGSG